MITSSILEINNDVEKKKKEDKMDCVMLFLLLKMEKSLNTLQTDRLVISYLFDCL